MNISRYANIDKFVNIRYIFSLARRAYSWLFQLAQMWKLLAPGVGLGDLLTPAWYFSIGFRNCSDSVALFYWIQELFRQRGIFLLDSGTVPTVWYCSIGFRNCSDSVVFLFCFSFYWYWYILQRVRAIGLIRHFQHLFSSIFIFTNYMGEESSHSYIYILDLCLYNLALGTGPRSQICGQIMLTVITRPLRPPLCIVIDIYSSDKACMNIPEG